MTICNQSIEKFFLEKREMKSNQNESKTLTKGGWNTEESSSRCFDVQHHYFLSNSISFQTHFFLLFIVWPRVLLPTSEPALERRRVRMAKTTGRTLDEHRGHERRGHERRGHERRDMSRGG